PKIVEGPSQIEEIANVTAISKNLAVTSQGLIYNLLSRGFLQDNLGDVIAVSGAVSRHVIALKGDGTVWAWGHNDLGQLGNGTFENSDLPVIVKNLTEVVAISANYDYNLALTKDGTVWFWGFEGREGEALRGRNIPVRIEGLTDVVLICAHNESLVMRKDGTHWVFNAKEKIPQSVPF
ncbi:MAG: RCC1 domain-containing protein, partial [bacterium]